MTDMNQTGAAIAIGPRIVASGGFDLLYREGMALIEEVASYLDGDGRAESRILSREASFVYATESMRLTTRLMQVASWLLLQRAINNGEMTRDQVVNEKKKVRLDAFNIDRTAPGWTDLPADFRELVEKSTRLQNRVAVLDREIYRPSDPLPAANNQNSVQAQLWLLKTAFGGH